MINAVPDTDLPDRQLWEAAVGGRDEAFGALFTRHHRAIYNFCFRRTGSWSTAEDLVAVVFLEAWRDRQRMRLQGDSLLPWLYGIAANVTRHQHRSTHRHRAALARMAATCADISDHADDVVDRLHDEQQMKEVLDGLRRLPRHEREVLELAIFAGLDYGEISNALEIPIGTVRSRLSRARTRLRRIVETTGTTMTTDVGK